jgi:hypothetical protein
MNNDDIRTLVQRRIALLDPLGFSKPASALPPPLRLPPDNQIDRALELRWVLSLLDK